MTSFMTRSRPLLASALLAALVLPTVFVLPTSAEASEEAPSEKANEEVAEETDETKTLLKSLTIAMISEVVDDRTVLIRDTSAKGKKQLIHLRLGNTGAPARGSLNDGEYEEKVRVSKGALSKLVDKQMIWYKAAPDSVQPASSADGEPQVVVADLWAIDGRHLNTALKKDGHLEAIQEYESELAQDILTAKAEIEKKESYKKLEEALKESEEHKRKMAKEAKAKEEEEEAVNDIEHFGLAGWAAVSFMIILVLGVASNFGRPSKKKFNLNRTKGPFEKFWTKMKGA